jgi:acyl-ACP thioesterase
MTIMPVVVEPHTTRFTIRTAEVDMHNLLKLSSLFLMMQEVAARHAAMSHFGFDDLARQQAFWVLSRAMVRIDHLPVSETAIHVTTWPRGVDKLFALRDFIFTDADGERLGGATTSWLILDRQTMRPRRPDIFNDVVFPDLPAALNENAPKINSHEHSTYSHSQTARYSDIDFNRHVNNSRYIDWMIDCLKSGELVAGEFSFAVNFNHQLALGDTINLYHYRDGETCFFEGRTQETTHVLAKMWK